MKIDHTLSCTDAWERDRRLSYKARGLLAELLSYDDGTGITIDDLADAKREPGAPREGRDAMRAAARELAVTGYVVKQRIRVSGRWRTDTYVFADPSRARLVINAGEVVHTKRLPDTSDIDPGRMNRRRFTRPGSDQAIHPHGTAYPASAEPSLLVTAQAEPENQSQKRAPKRGPEDPGVSTNGSRQLREADDSWPTVAVIPGADLSWANQLYANER